MDSKITINIVEPGSAPVVPDTGLFTAGIGGPEATIITAVSTVLLLTIVAVVVAMLYKKHKHQGKTTKLVSTVDACATVVKSKKRISAGLAAIALLVSAGTFAGLLVNAGKSNTNAAEGEDEAIAPVVSGDELTIELGNEPVFAVAKTEVTVEKEMPAGYTLTAFAESTDLVSTTDGSSTIPMIVVDEGELAALTDNTYGLSLAEPASQDEEVYTTLSTDADNPTLLAEKEEGTEANDTTTIYYGFYIAPDTPYGTYTSGDVYYDVEENGPASVTVIFDGNDKFYFDGDSSQTTNVAKYIPGLQGETYYSHTTNLNDAGEFIDPTYPNNMYPTGVNETFVYNFPNTENIYFDLVKTGSDSCSVGESENNDMFLSFWSGSHPEYTANGDYESGIRAWGNTTGKYIFSLYAKNESLSANISGSSVTLAYTTANGGTQRGCSSGYGYYAVITGYNPNTLIFGEYEKPTTDGAYRFLGWSEDKNATVPTYTTKDEIIRNLDLTKGDVTLYAISEPAFTISYNGNGADTTTNMDNIEQYTTNVESTSQVDLLASNFTREGYGFAGWSTDQDAASKINNTGDDKPTIYGPNQMITVDPSASIKLNLYAVWIPAETSVTMQTFNPNSEPYASKPNGTVIALEDERDEEVYAVAKLADGNYWMIENLRLDNEPELSANNTHNPNLPLTNNYEEQTTSNKLSASSDSWCNSWSTTEEQIACYDHSDLNTNNVANTVASPSFSQDFTSSAHSSNFEGNIASYGNYYNWYSATAGQGTYSVSSGNAAGDICPTGWQLPYGGRSSSTGGGNTKGGFYYLNQQMGGGTSATDSNNWRSFPNNFVYSGYWLGSSAGGRGVLGSYWSSTARSNDSASPLSLSSVYVTPDGNSNKYSGYSVRCVAPVQ